MPELPEVETVRRGLSRLIIGKKIVRINHDTPKSFPNSDNDVSTFIIGASIVSIRRRAKILLIDLSTQYTLVIHLKMTGQMVYVGNERFGAGHPNDSLLAQLPDKSTRVKITFADDTELFFNDQRKFGWMKLYPMAEVSNIDFMRRVGPEPLTDSFTNKDFISRIRRRSGTTIKAAILDQTVLAGVGNIYADESLWQARIHPATRVRDVSDKQLSMLLASIKSIMRLSIAYGGSSARNYVDAEGKRGSYLQFANVFRREGLPCSRHPDITIVKIRVAGRGTHICPACQLQSGAK